MNLALKMIQLNYHPLFGSKLERKGSDLTIIATSVMVLEAKRAAIIAKNDISVEIINLHNITPRQRNDTQKC